MKPTSPPRLTAQPGGPLGPRGELTDIRERMGMSLRAFAKAAGVSYETVRRVEAGFVVLPHQGPYGVDYRVIVPHGARDLARTDRAMRRAAHGLQVAA